MLRRTVPMKCPRCKHENPVQAKFCLECGARLSPVCAKCQTQLPAGAKFCLECGEPIAGQSPAFPSPETYTPKHLTVEARLRQGLQSLNLCVQTVLRQRGH